MPYYVDSSSTNPNEPSPGWYYCREDEDGSETRVGPFASKAEALDDESDGAYSEWQADQRKGDYERYMRDAGRGHLLRNDD